jgi:hypothetical protein
MKLILTGSRCAKNRQESVGNPGNPLLPSGIQKRQTACAQLNQAAGTKSVSCVALQQCRVRWGYGQPMDMIEHTVDRVRPGGQLGSPCPCLKAPGTMHTKEQGLSATQLWSITLCCHCRALGPGWRLQLRARAHLWWTHEEGLGAVNSFLNEGASEL